MLFEIINQYCSDCLSVHLLCYSGKKSWEKLYLIYEVLRSPRRAIVFTLTLEKNTIGYLNSFLPDLPALPGACPLLLLTFLLKSSAQLLRSDSEEESEREHAI
jgi:hypothetical protein